jgi:hypothetical protein
MRDRLLDQSPVGPEPAGHATNMKLYDPGHQTVDNQGLLYITDYFNHRAWAVRYRNQ